MLIIGLAGAARAGKDTTAGFIKEWGEESGGVLVERFAFAEKLKVSAALALALATKGSTVAECVEYCDRLKADGSQITVELSRRTRAPRSRWRRWLWNRRGSTGAKLQITGRAFLQNYGTEAHRDVFGDDFWVDALLDEILPHGPDDPRMNSIVVISDVRFANEARRIRNAGGEIWEVVRPDNNNALENNLNAHVSESGVPEDLIDHTILNNGDLAHLEREIAIACWERF